MQNNAWRVSWNAEHPHHPSISMHIIYESASRLCQQVVIRSNRIAFLNINIMERFPVAGADLAP
jgi:hypothetical protein